MAVEPAPSSPAILNFNEFLTLVQREFRRHGTIVEKYDVVYCSSDLSGDIRFGHRSNEAGFGWTNAVFTALLGELPAPERRSPLIKKKRGTSAPSPPR